MHLTTARRPFALALALALLAIPAYASARLSAIRAAPDPPTLAARWIEAHVDPCTERVLLIPFVDLPLVRTTEALHYDDNQGEQAERFIWRGFSPWRSYQVRRGPAGWNGPRYDLRTAPLARARDREAAVRDPIEYLRQSGARYFVVAAQSSEYAHAAFEVLQRALHEHAHLVERFASASAYNDGAVTLGYEDPPAPWSVNWTYALILGNPIAGDVVELYELS